MESSNRSVAHNPETVVMMTASFSADESYVLIDAIREDTPDLFGRLIHYADWYGFEGEEGKL